MNLSNQSFINGTSKYKLENVKDLYKKIYERM